MLVFVVFSLYCLINLQHCGKPWRWHIYSCLPPTLNLVCYVWLYYNFVFNCICAVLRGSLLCSCGLSTMLWNKGIIIIPPRRLWRSTLPSCILHWSWWLMTWWRRPVDYSTVACVCRSSRLLTEKRTSSCMTSDLQTWLPTRCMRSVARLHTWLRRWFEALGICSIFWLLRPWLHRK